MKILFQGDSITDAFRKPEERNPGFQLGNGYAFLVAASLSAEYPDRGWEFFNRGVSGNVIASLAERWMADTLEIAPDFLSILIGVNDTIWGELYGLGDDHGRFVEIYASLLDSVQLRLPETNILLLEPFLLEVGTVTPAWIGQIRGRQREIARLAAEHGLPLVPLQTIFDQACDRAPASYWAFDGIHPTHAGARLIADAWLKAAEPICVSQVERQVP